MAKLLKVGDPMPDVTLPDPAGEPVRLHDLTAPLVVYFYPADDTPGCTKEACSFRDQYEDFTDAGATVVGISPDSQKKHARFAAKHDLPFTLLSDRGGEARKSFGVPKVLGFLTGRVTFVIGSDHTVRHVFESQLQATRHVTEALEAVRAARTTPADAA